MSVVHPETGETFHRQSQGEFAIDSDPEHEQWLLETFPDQFARNKDRVPKTPDELAGIDRHEQNAAVAAREAAKAAAAVLVETRGRVNRALRTSE
jgi:hypothetical protein